MFIVTETMKFSDSRSLEVHANRWPAKVTKAVMKLQPIWFRHFTDINSLTHVMYICVTELLSISAVERLPQSVSFYKILHQLKNSIRSSIT